MMMTLILVQSKKLRSKIRCALTKFTSTKNVYFQAARTPGTTFKLIQTISSHQNPFEMKFTH